MDTAVSILLHGLASAMILYIVAVGLSITMGLMGFVNLAHGAFAMAGGYAAVWFSRQTGMSFLMAALAATISVGLVSIILERLFYAKLYAAGELDQVLFTIGVLFVATAVAKFLFGPAPMNIELPAMLRGQTDLVIRQFPTYRLAIIVLGFALFLALWFAVERTLLGARIRASVDNSRIAQTVGIRTERLFVWTFALGSGLAAFGGAVGAELIPLRPNYAIETLNYVLVVVAVGGSGSLTGPFIAAILLGISDTACRYLIPDLGVFFIYLTIIGLLLWRPNGLLERV